MAHARQRLGMSGRLRALGRGLRGFVLGVPDRPPRPARPQDPASAKPAPRVEGVRELVRVSPVRTASDAIRLNVIVPSVAGDLTFGGIQTAIDLFEAVADGIERRRIISALPIGPDDAAAFPSYRYLGGDEAVDDARQLVAVAHAGAPLVVGANDVFIATHWTTAAMVLDVRRWQAETYGRAPARFAYLIQDYEPGFYPWSASYMLARATYDAPDSTVAIFNTDLLQRYFHDVGIRFPSEFSFEPRLSGALRRVLGGPGAARQRRILVYGRPSKPRNLFPFLVDGLRAWRGSTSLRFAEDGSGWSVVSAGQSHPDVELGGGTVMRSLGKLDLDAYGACLRGSAVGVSMMASPHPSYPPLEMAQLGLLVLTNRFGEKDLSEWHTNITSLRAVSPVAFAEDLDALCRRFDADPGVGDRGRSLRPAYLDDGPQFPFAGEVAVLLRDGVTALAPS
jgi:hypothetical protein